MWMYECNGFESETLADLASRIAAYYTDSWFFPGGDDLRVVFRNGGVANMSTEAKQWFKDIVECKIDDLQHAIKECEDYDQQLRNPATFS